ncbi:MAG TPA: hypothetical protein DIT32_03450 [Peptococcaceae bacterium]|nr:hypothetical protein [Peptococcaceae bacterium]
MEVFKLFGSILVDSSKAEESIAKTEKKAESLGSKLGAGIKTAGKWALGIGAAAVGVGTAMTGMVMKVADSAGSIDDMSQKTGIAASELQKYAYAAKLSGMETATLEGAMLKQQKAFTDAKTGSKSMSEAYKSLGVDISNMGSSGEAFDVVIKKLADMKDETKRNSLANSIFGKSYAELAPLLNNGSEGIEALKNEAVELGGVMSDDAVAAGAKFGDTIDKLKTAGQGLFNQLGSELMPYVQKAADWIITHMPEIKKYTKSAFETISKVVKTAAEIFDSLKPILEPLWEFIKWAFPKMLTITENVFGAIKPIIEGVGAVFNGVADAIQWAYDKWMKWTGREGKDEDPSPTGDDIDGGGGGSRGGSSDRSRPHRNGLAYVPYDGYLAKLHRGERVLTANQNLAYAGGTTVNHTGTIRVEGVNDKKQLLGVVEIIMDDLRREGRR